MSKRYVLLGMTLTLAIALAVPAMGGPSNPLASAAASAKKTAKKALKRAKAAKKAADAAQSTANTANTKAGNAQSAADAAQGAANGAKSTADSAAAAAAAAQGTADNALSAANAAQATADGKLGGVTPEFGETVPADSENKTAGSGCGLSSGNPITGGGYAITGAGSNDVTVVASSTYLNGWFVNVEEIGGGTAETWAVQAVALCATQ